MARFDQHMGLNEWAREFVAGNPKVLYHEESVRRYGNGHKEFVAEHPIFGRTVVEEASEHYYEGMFGDQFPLERYKFDDGRVFEERVLADPWSSGPQFYLALVEIKDGQETWVEESRWTEILGVEKTAERVAGEAEQDGDYNGYCGYCNEESKEETKPD